MQILGYVSRVQDVESKVDADTFTMEQVESTPVRCPDPAAAELMYKGAQLGCSLRSIALQLGDRMAA